MNTCDTDLLVLGGGAAGLSAALFARRLAPSLSVTVVEKAHIARSGCLAMGLNAINLYLNRGTADDYVEYVRKDGHSILRTDLVKNLGEHCNRMVGELSRLGVDIPLFDGVPIARSARSIRMNGENIKECLAARVADSDVKVFNHLPVYALTQDDHGNIVGASGFDVCTGQRWRFRARAVILTTGGAAGMYRPSNQRGARKKIWYCPYNTGAGLAMGIRVGAEMTSFESRFIPLRTKDVVAPTGTMAFVKAIRQLNARGEPYLENISAMLGRSLTTSERLAYTIQEHRQGNGPCLMDLSELTTEKYHALADNYLHMSPVLSLLMLSSERVNQVEVIGSDPYVNGGHGLGGYWVDEERRTTVPGLWVAGDIAGGAPKKYLTGCMVEAELAVCSALDNLAQGSSRNVRMNWNDDCMLRPLDNQSGITYLDLEERLQKIMDEYAGGASQYYEYSASKLVRARALLSELNEIAQRAEACDPWQTMSVNEIRELITVSMTLVEHMLARQETRWPAYQSRQDFPLRNDIEFSCFINSVLENGTLRVFRRELNAPYRERSLPDVMY